MSDRAVDPSLLPHDRPCWCADCKRAYQTIYDKTYKPKRKYPSRISTCVDCGGECSALAARCWNCSIVARRPVPRVKTCACGAELPHNARNGRTDRCRKCYLASVTKTIWHKRMCMWCGRIWQSRNADARYCSGSCRRADRGFHPVVKKPRRVRGVCSTCGAACEHFVCASCKYEVKRMHRRIYNNRRRGAQGYSKYKKREIAVRDGWLCHLCGGSVAPHLWGSSHPDAPTIDHLVPVSRGGFDTDDNVKLAHRICNMRKSNKVGESGGTRTKRESGSVDAQAA